MSKAPPISPQEELALSSVASHALFPGRTTLYVAEVAKALGLSSQHVIKLIEEYRDTGGKSGLFAINIANGLRSATNPGGNATPRSGWRVPVSAFDEFVRRAAGFASATPSQGVAKISNPATQKTQ